MRPGKTESGGEGQHHGSFTTNLGIPTLAKVIAPGTTEAGDMVWLDAKTLLIGHGYRTNSAGHLADTEFARAQGNRSAFRAVPYGNGPSECLHFMSLISLLDEWTALVDLPWLAVETVELLKARGFRLIEIDYSERGYAGLQRFLAGREAVACDRRESQDERVIASAGFDVRTFPGSEICINGGGGPTCLTRPLLRA